MSIALWYIARDNRKLGPYRWEQLIQMAAAGQLGPADLVLPQGAQRWARADAIPGLFPAPSPAAAPVVTQPASSGPTRFWLNRGGQFEGPFLLEQLIGWLANGQLAPDSLVCPDGGDCWKPIRHWTASCISPAQLSAQPPDTPTEAQIPEVVPLEPVVSAATEGQSEPSEGSSRSGRKKAAIAGTAGISLATILTFLVGVGRVMNQDPYLKRQLVPGTTTRLYDPSVMKRWEESRRPTAQTPPDSKPVPKP